MIFELFSSETSLHRLGDVWKWRDSVTFVVKTYLHVYLIRKWYRQVYKELHRLPSNQSSLVHQRTLHACECWEEYQEWNQFHRRQQERSQDRSDQATIRTTQNFMTSYLGEQMVCRSFLRCSWKFWKCCASPKHLRLSCKLLEQHSCRSDTQAAQPPSKQQTLLWRHILTGWQRCDASPTVRRFPAESLANWLPRSWRQFRCVRSLGGRALKPHNCCMT